MRYKLQSVLLAHAKSLRPDYPRTVGTVKAKDGGRRSACWFVAEMAPQSVAAVTRELGAAGWADHPKFKRQRTPIEDPSFQRVRDGFGVSLADPFLMRMLEDRILRGSSELDSSATPEIQDTRVPVVMRLDSPDWLPPATLHLDTRMGRFASARLTVEQIRQLSNDPAVTSIEGSRATALGELTRSKVAIRTESVHARPVEELGDSALIAVVDDGIDVFHHCFTSGSDPTLSRIVAVWDQRQRDAPPSGPVKYGRFHSDTDLDRYLRSGRVEGGLGRDPLGHGTHVASIAAGRAVGAFAGGVAPGARIVVVVTNPDADANSLFDALGFIETMAKNRPVVVNLSYGRTAGAHDGSSEMECYLEEFTGRGQIPGRVVVKSAGNEANDRLHAHLAIQEGRTRTLSWLTRAGPRVADVLEVWFDPANELEFVLEDPSGYKSALTTASLRMTRGPLGQHDVSLDYTRAHRSNGKSQLAVRVKARNGGEIDPGNWKLEVFGRLVRGDPNIEAWIERSGATPEARFEPRFASNEHTLSIPGTAHSVITVAAANEQADVASFSSWGGTWDGRQQPHLCAPGVGIVAARSGTDSDTISHSGTSMAAPHVSGALALLMSRRERDRARDPNLAQFTAHQLRSFLRQAAGPLGPGTAASASSTCTTFSRWRSPCSRTGSGRSDAPMGIIG